jgi:serine/threonine-protein kinase HipA
LANIFVNRQAVGTLSRDEPLNRFVYAAGVHPPAAVSLLMPVVSEPYLAERAGALHPVFDMSLPEGALREAVSNMFAKALPVFDDLALFQIVGRSLIGRLRCGESANELDQVPAQNLKDLLHSRGTNELFAELLRRYAEFSGVAGIQPKVLVRDNGSLQSENMSPIETEGRLTAHGTTHIVKSFDATKYPGLAANEFLCLKACHAAGLTTAKAELARDARVLVVERFDLKSDGTYLGFEDSCALDGRLSREKYEGSYEQLAATLTNVVRGPEGTGAELARFFRSLVLSIAVRNGDAHRKNFGVVYDDAAGYVSLAPAFDVITTTAYLRDDSLALTMDGTKRWPDAKRLERFGIRRCQLSAANAKTIIAEVRDAVARVGEELDNFEELDPTALDTAEKMRTAWNEGVATLRSAS